MKKIILTLSACVLLGACAQTEYVEKECPSCNPPVRHFEVVTECSDYRDTSLGGNKFAQCRYCTNKIYSNGVDVTAQFMGKVPGRRHANIPCNRR
ncbi:MAG: hypothetical protein IKS41_05785 [Alphaproteobacteria bacterium]|nr:hypothetical protein [Alphaproteobacteria bacterium]